MYGKESETDFKKIQRPKTSEKILDTSDVSHNRMFPTKQNATFHACCLYCQERSIMVGGFGGILEATYIVCCIAADGLMESSQLAEEDQIAAASLSSALQRTMGK